FSAEDSSDDNDPRWSGDVAYHAGDSPFTLEYGSRNGAASYPLDSDGEHMTYHGVFNRSNYSTDATCPGHPTTQGVDGLGVCRHMSSRLANFGGSDRWTYELDEYGPRMSMVVDKTDVGSSERFHFVGMQSNRAHNNTPASGTFGSDIHAVAEL